MRQRSAQQTRSPRDSTRYSRAPGLQAEIGRSARSRHSCLRSQRSAQDRNRSAARPIAETGLGSYQRSCRCASDTRPRNTGQVRRPAPLRATCRGWRVRPHPTARGGLFYFSRARRAASTIRPRYPPTAAARVRPPRCAVSNRNCHHAATAGESVAWPPRLSDLVIGEHPLPCVLLRRFGDPIGRVHRRQVPIDREREQTRQQRRESVRADRRPARRHALDRCRQSARVISWMARGPQAGRTSRSQRRLVRAPAFLFRPRVLVEIQVDEVRNRFGCALRFLHRRRIAACACSDDGGARRVRAVASGIASASPSVNRRSRPRCR